jgi:hypothetical protein
MHRAPIVPKNSLSLSLNPDLNDIVEHYSENVVDTFHKKNFLLLSEDGRS